MNYRYIIYILCMVNEKVSTLWMWLEENRDIV